MKLSWFSIIPILTLPFIFDRDEVEPDLEMTVDTGIMLDTLGNEIKLFVLNDEPQYYFANIFTPVCNTGECLPVYVNFYWNLNGNYQKFDQPEGEILTKLDHEPFTEEDYDLLNDILMSGVDPRLSGQVKHYKGSADENMSSPAPEAIRILTKYEMVDAVTGSTLPEVRAKFVPGALYTTYTLWGLAHDPQTEMRNYTNFSLVTPDYYEFFLSHSDYSFREKVVTKLAGNSEDPNIHAKICASLLDTSSNIAIKERIVDNFYWNEIQTDEVQAAFLKEFNETESKNLKKALLYKWAYNHISDEVYLAVTKQLSKDTDFIDAYVDLYSNKPKWPDAVFDEVSAQLEGLSAYYRNSILQVMEDNKEYFSKDQNKRVKELAKKYR